MHDVKKHKMVFEKEVNNKTVFFKVETLNNLILGIPKHYRCHDRNYCVEKTDEMYFVPYCNEVKNFGMVVGTNSKQLLYAELSTPHSVCDVFITQMRKRR